MLNHSSNGPPRNGAVYDQAPTRCRRTVQGWKHSLQRNWGGATALDERGDGGGQTASSAHSRSAGDQGSVRRQTAHRKGRDNARRPPRRQLVASDCHVRRRGGCFAEARVILPASLQSRDADRFRSPHRRDAQHLAGIDLVGVGQHRAVGLEDDVLFPAVALAVLSLGNRRQWRDASKTCAGR